MSIVNLRDHKKGTQLRNIRDLSERYGLTMKQLQYIICYYNLDKPLPAVKCVTDKCKRKYYYILEEFDEFMARHGYKPKEMEER